MPFELPTTTPGTQVSLPQLASIVVWISDQLNTIATSNTKYQFLNALLISYCGVGEDLAVPPPPGTFETDPHVPLWIKKVAEKIIKSLEDHNKQVLAILNSLLWKFDFENINLSQVQEACIKAKNSGPSFESQYCFDKKPFTIRYTEPIGGVAESWNISYQKNDGNLGTVSYPNMPAALDITNGITSKAQKIKPKTIEKDFGKEIKETEFDNFLDAIGNTLQKEGTYIFDTKPYKIKLSGTNYETTLPDGTLITDTKVNVMKAILTITEPPIIKDFWDSITEASILALLTQVRLSKAQKGSYKFRDKTLKITDGGEKIEYLIPEQRGWFGKSIPEKISTIKDSNLNTLARELEKVSQVKPYTKKTKTKKEKPSNSEKKEWEKDWKKPEEVEIKEEKKVKANIIKRFFWSPQFIEQIKAPAVRGIMKAGYRMTMTGVTLGAASVVWWVWVSAMIVGAMTTTFLWSLTWSLRNWFNKKYIDKDNK